MNKEGWKKNKWSDVLTIINGKNQKMVESPDGEFPIYGSGGIMGYANDWLCPENCVIIGRKGSINKPIFVKTKFWNVDTAFGLKANNDTLIPRFLYYFCNYFNFETLNKAVTIPSLTKADLLKIEIQLPPLSEQQQIVEELDLLSGIIEKKKEQLKELDNLAQSIFYEMFGDPVANEKGWETSLLGKCCSKITDGSHNPPPGVDFSNYMMLSSKNVTYQGFTFDEPRYLSKEEFEAEDKRTQVHKGDVFLVIVGAGVGKCCVYDSDTKITLQRSVAVIRPYYDILQSTYVKCFLENSYSTLCNEAKGAAQKGIYLKQLNTLGILLPPLPLQQSFASKIEAIE